jgi:Fe-S-cluster-containing dehydrogenase component
MKKKDSQSNRRKFLANTLKLGTVLAAGTGSVMASGKSVTDEREKIKVLTTDGKLIEVDKPDECKIDPCTPPGPKESRKGIPGRKFVYVVDLSKCANARKCIEGCQKGHNLAPETEWMNVYLMKDNPEGSPYWFPRMCFHCDNPPCVKVCPVGATYKRQDHLVLVDKERCIGCKFCLAACPYSVRIFNWKKPPESDVPEEAYSPETSVPALIGTVSKCDFCADLSRKGTLPYCVRSCPMGALYFGDENEDAVTNGTETRRFKQLIKDRFGFRYREELGTQPNTYYLPPVDRMFDYKDGLKNVPEEKQKIYDEIINSSDEPYMQ